MAILPLAPMPASILDAKSRLVAISTMQKAFGMALPSRNNPTQHRQGKHQQSATGVYDNSEDYKDDGNKISRRLDYSAKTAVTSHWRQGDDDNNNESMTATTSQRRS